MAFLFQRKAKKGIVESEQKATSRTKISARPEMIMLCIWWNSQGVLYCKLLPRGVTITADIYFQQLRRLPDAMQEKRATRLRDASAG